MSLPVAVVKSRALTAARAVELTVEVHLANGLPCFVIVGLADTEVRESRERVRAAIQNSRFEFPTRRIKCSQWGQRCFLSRVALSAQECVAGFRCCISHCEIMCFRAHRVSRLFWQC